MERLVHDLNDSIEDKMPTLRLAQTRLQKRTARPGQELVRDPAQTTLARCGTRRACFWLSELDTLLMNNTHCPELINRHACTCTNKPTTRRPSDLVLHLLTPLAPPSSIPLFVLSQGDGRDPGCHGRLAAAEG